jgi:histone H2A
LNIGKTSVVQMAGAMEYLCAEILEIAGVCTMERKKVRMMPRDIELAVRGDEDLAAWLKNETFFGAGTAPYINPSVLNHGI